MEIKRLWVHTIEENHTGQLALFDELYMIVHYWQWETNGKQRYILNDKVFKSIEALYNEVESTYGTIIATEQ